MDENNGEKSHDPTPHRRQQAREKGQVAKSQDLAAALMLLIALILLLTHGRHIAIALYNYGTTTIGGEAWLVADANHLISYGTSSALLFLGHLAGIFIILVIAGVLVNMAQIGILFLPDKLALDIKHIDPIKGLKRIFSMQSVMRLVMGIVKIVICCIVAYYATYSELENIFALAMSDETQSVIYLLTTLLWIGIKVAVALVLIAILDFMFQKWKHEQDLKMTTQQVRDEMKNTVGNPEIMSKRRQIQREMAQQRLSGAVPQADVVVTNPTELAVALKYDDDTMNAPIVVAKGAGFMAQQIRRIALQHGIPTVERKPLAQALFKNCDIGQPIPGDQYSAVAEVLAYVYRLKKKKITPRRRAA